MLDNDGTPRNQRRMYIVLYTLRNSRDDEDSCGFPQFQMGQLRPDHSGSGPSAPFATIASLCQAS